jgi:hypothetical protein
MRADLLAANDDPLADVTILRRWEALALGMTALPTLQP